MQNDFPTIIGCFVKQLSGLVVLRDFDTYETLRGTKISNIEMITDLPLNLRHVPFARCEHVIDMDNDCDNVVVFLTSINASISSEIGVAQSVTKHFVELRVPNTASLFESIECLVQSPDAISAVLEAGRLLQIDLFLQISI